MLARRTPLKATKPMKRQPMRKGRRNPRLEPTALEQRHMDRVRLMGCVVTGHEGDLALHHVMKCEGKTKRRDHRFVVALIHDLHNRGDQSVHALGSEARFKEVHGVDLAAIAVREWENTCGAMEVF
jgi:hypothetical protein